MANHFAARYRIRRLEDTAFAIVFHALKLEPSMKALTADSLNAISSKLLFFYGQSGPSHPFSQWPGYMHNKDSVFAKKILEIIGLMMPDGDVVFKQIEKSYKLKVGEDFNMMAIGEQTTGNKQHVKPCLSLNVERL